MIIMSKGKDVKEGKGKTGKKTAVLNLKEKRAAKQAKRAKKGSGDALKFS